MSKEARKQVTDVKAVRGAEIGSDHYLVLMKINLKVKRMKRRRQEGYTRQIRIDNLKNDEVRRKYQAMIAELYKEAKARGGVSETDVERAWKELKEGIVGAVMRVCGTTRRRNGEVKRTRWWNEEVKGAVREK